MRKPFGVVPPEVPAVRTSLGSAPKFIAAIDQMLKALEGGLPEHPFEWLRTAARQSFLYGFGRDYDDGRGIVTSAKSSLYSHHGVGGGLDVVEKDKTPWNAPPSFWNDIGDAAEGTGLLKWGGRWRSPDLPHVYYHTLPASMYGTVGDAIRALHAAKGIEAVWAKWGMI